LFSKLADEVSAYQVQAENTSHSLAAGRRLVGRKIGLTAKVVQQQLGVGSPDYAMLFADMSRSDDEEVLAGHVLQPKLEAEVALVMGRGVLENGRRHCRGITSIIRAAATILQHSSCSLIHCDIGRRTKVGF
jgi:2-keto-4-pentenoate hydratase